MIDRCINEHQFAILRRVELVMECPRHEQIQQAFISYEQLMRRVVVALKARRFFDADLGLEATLIPDRHYHISRKDVLRNGSDGELVVIPGVSLEFVLTTNDGVLDQALLQNIAQNLTTECGVQNFVIELYDTSHIGVNA